VKGPVKTVILDVLRVTRDRLIIKRKSPPRCLPARSVIAIIKDATPI
jgi:hypothetical protein